MTKEISFKECAEQKKKNKECSVTLRLKSLLQKKKAISIKVIENSHDVWAMVYFVDFKKKNVHGIMDTPQKTNETKRTSFSFEEIKDIKVKGEIEA